MSCIARISTSVFMVQLMAACAGSTVGTTPAASETIQKVLQAAVCMEPLLRAPVVAPPAPQLAALPPTVLVVPAPTSPDPGNPAVVTGK